MSDMKCPFCQQELDYLAEDIYGGMYCPKCKKQDLFGNEKMWQELIRTRKALDVIKKEMSKETMPDFAVIHNALKGVSDE